MQVQEAISRERLKAKVGSVQRVLIDDVGSKGATAIGRSMADAPEIDGVVHVKAPARSTVQLNVGEFVDVHIESNDTHDLMGVPT